MFYARLDVFCVHLSAELRRFAIRYDELRKGFDWFGRDKDINAVSLDRMVTADNILMSSKQGGYGGLSKATDLALFGNNSMPSEFHEAVNWMLVQS